MGWVDGWLKWLRTAAVSEEEGLQSSGETCKLLQSLPSSVQVCNILAKLN